MLVLNRTLSFVKSWTSTFSTQPRTACAGASIDDRFRYATYLAWDFADQRAWACTYTAGVEVSDFSKHSGEFAGPTIAANRYTVFSHHGHVDKLADTIDQILKKWLPASGLALENRSTGTPVFFE